MSTSSKRNDSTLDLHELMPTREQTLELADEAAAQERLRLALQRSVRRDQGAVEPAPVAPPAGSIQPAPASPRKQTAEPPVERALLPSAAAPPVEKAVESVGAGATPRRWTRPQLVITALTLVLTPVAIVAVLQLLEWRLGSHRTSTYQASSAMAIA